MKIIPKKCIEAVKAAVPILAHVESSTQLRQKGDAFVGRSPLVDHDPGESLSVYTTTGKFKCAASQKYGDAIDFEMALSGTKFVEAVEFLAKSAGVVLEYEEGTPPRRRKSRPNGKAAA